MFSLPNIESACPFALEDVNETGHKNGLVTAQTRFLLVEPGGFEPPTSSMPSRRAPNCATAPPALEMIKTVASWRHAVKREHAAYSAWLMTRRAPVLLSDLSQDIWPRKSSRKHGQAHA